MFDFSHVQAGEGSRLIVKNILIIEHDMEVTTLLESALSGDCTFIQSVRDEQACPLLLAKRPFDVVIADIISENFDNVEFFKRLNRMEPHPRVIAMTGYTGSQNREHLSDMAEDLSIERLFFKPFSMVELQKLVFQFEGG
jgi:response regulator RpfG family c-di-GMP phosphodiesterase